MPSSNEVSPSPMLLVEVMGNSNETLLPLQAREILVRLWQFHFSWCDDGVDLEI